MLSGPALVNHQPSSFRPLADAAIIPTVQLSLPYNPDQIHPCSDTVGGPNCLPFLSSSSVPKVARMVGFFFSKIIKS